ncbi:hypothetical protein RJ639_015939, partial [Escallonia herrerae]
MPGSLDLHCWLLTCAGTAIGRAGAVLDGRMGVRLEELVRAHGRLLEGCGGAELDGRGGAVLGGDVTFDESLMLSKKEELIDARKDHVGKTVLILPMRMKNLRNSSKALLEIDREERFDLLITALYDLEIEQLDVKTSFAYGELEKQIFMHQSEVFVIQDKEDHVSLLKKSLYGLKQSPRQVTLYTIVALSTTEAEYIAATEAMKEDILLKGLVGDLGLKQESST